MNTSPIDPGAQPRVTAETTAASDGMRFSTPVSTDGPELWRLARDTGLDINSPYAYTLWCRDFAETSVAARDETGALRGFVTGYIRPADPGTYFLWQVGVDARMRGRRLARRMLDHLAERFPALGVSALEATVTPDNAASRALFASFAAAHGARDEWSPLFESRHFPSKEHSPSEEHGPTEGEGHEPEDLVRIAPVRPRATAPTTDPS